MQDIFVSYRRQDSQSAAGRLSDHLRDQLPGVRIFRDVETIDPGVDFVDAIGRALKSCAVLLAVIGPRWSSIEDGRGRRRLDDPHDYTRLEIATALARRGVRVIPVLVDGALMPGAAELPDDLQALARRNAIELTDKRFDYDVSQLSATLRPLVGLPEPNPEEAARQQHERTPAKRRKVGWIAGGVVLGLAAIGAMIEEPGPAAPPSAQVYVPPLSPAPQSAINLSGLWADNGGGQHRLTQQGNQLAIEGLSPAGVVLGGGSLEGVAGRIDYTVNGYAMVAEFAASPDGMHISGVITDPASGAQTPLQMWRTQ